ncbi:family A G protein-coupled receptor-like protein [Violaceomyces palustris]|uniref:Family A G protein-coupled receptor-like protein n=1 Tax=Violaceomyces palustris TaxID=1673888 RepID=A0ACD0NZ06_9BASI|nr:family A G protein-coupled receptor-like protein [Violaceomyces palustris]
MSTLQNLAARAGNEAIQVNPNVADLDLGPAGSDFLWMVFSVMAASGLGSMIWGFRVERGQRAFHYLSAAILATASVAYFSMASDLGATPITVEFLQGNELVNGMYPKRAIWYVRYIDWTITTPLLLLEILLVSGLPLSTIFITIFFDLVMIITGLVGALVQSTYKWGYFTMGCVAMFYVFYVLYGPGLKSAGALGAEYKKAYLYSTSILCFLWFIYPIAWGLCDGGNVIDTNAEMYWYGILDILAKPVFAFFHLWEMRGLDYNKLALKSGKFSEFEIGSKAVAEANEGGLHIKQAEADVAHSSRQAELGTQ